MRLSLCGHTIAARPGVALSLMAHAAFLIWLAYVLAFRAPLKIEEPPVADPTITLIPPSPPPPPPNVPEKQSLFQPKPSPRLISVPTNVNEFPVPATPEIRRPTPSVIVTDDPPIVVQPRVLSRSNPVYPDRAADANIQGHVDIAGTVAPDGTFSDGRIIAETPQGYGFASSLMRVIPKWKFEPKTINGTPVPYQIRYRFSFALR